MIGQRETCVDTPISTIENRCLRLGLCVYGRCCAVFCLVLKFPLWTYLGVETPYLYFLLTLNRGS